MPQLRQTAAPSFDHAAVISKAMHELNHRNRVGPIRDQRAIAASPTSAEDLTTWAPRSLEPLLR